MAHVVTISSTQSFTIPEGCTSIDAIECWGAGADGGTGASTLGGGGGGGGGAYSKKTSALAVTPGDVWTATVGTHGGDTSFVKGGTTACLAKGGTIGANGSTGTQGAGGAGGAAASGTGDTKFSGGGGGGSNGNTSAGGGGGSSAGTGANGGNGSATDPGSGCPGGTAPTGGGNGGASITAGTVPGGGGGGGSGSGFTTGASGAAGQIILTYNQFFARSASVNSVGTAGSSRTTVLAKAFSANAVGSAAMSRLLAIHKAVSATATGTAAWARNAHQYVAASANAVATASGFAFRFLRAIRFPNFFPTQTIYDEIHSPATNIRRRVDILELDGTTLWRYDAPTVDGVVSVDASRQERRSLEITFDNRDGTLRHSPLDLWYDKIIRPYRGVTLVDGSYWEVPLGEFMIDAIDSESFPHTVNVKGRDRSKLLIVNEFTQTTTFTADKTLNEIVHTIATNAGIARFGFPTTGGPLLGKDFTFDRETSRAKALDDLTTPFAYEWYFDATGMMILRPFLDPISSPSQYTFKSGPSGSIAHYKKATADTQLFNSILVYSSRTDVIPVWAVARNTVFGSATSIDKIGERVYPFKSAILETTEQCQELADKLLKTMSLDEYSVDLSSLVLPWLDAGNIIEFDDPDPDPNQPLRFLLHDFTIPLALTEMTASAKRLVIAVFGNNLIKPTQNTSPPPYAATSTFTDVAWLSQSTQPYSHSWTVMPENDPEDWINWQYQAKLVSASGVIKASLQAHGADPGGGAARKVVVFSMSGGADTVSASLGPTFTGGSTGLVANSGGVRSITVDYDWVAGNQYRFLLSVDGNDGSGHPGWGLWVTNLNTSAMTLVGHIYVDASLGNIDSALATTISTDRFGPYTPASEDDIHYAGALFTDFVMANGLPATGFTNRFSTTVVSERSAISNVPNGVRHELGTLAPL